MKVNRHIFWLGLSSIITAILTTFQCWKFQLFSDDWIWLLIAQELDWSRPVQLITARFSGFWRPTMTLWFMVTRDLNNYLPLIQHLFSIIFLAINGFLAALIVFKITRKFWPSLLTSLFIIINSTSAEVWLWYSSIGDLLLGTCLLTLLLIAEYRERKWFLPLFISIIILALGTKETAAVFLPLIAIYPPYWQMLKKKDWPLISSLIIIFIAYLAWQLSTGTRGHDLAFNLLHLKSLSLSWLAIWLPIINSLYFQSIIVAVAALGTLGLIILISIRTLFNNTQEQKFAAWGLLASVGFLLPPSLLPVDPINPLMSSRYLFLPAICLAISIGIILTRGNKRVTGYIISIIWLVTSFLMIRNIINTQYLPLSEITMSVSQSLDKQVRQVTSGGRLIVTCSFPYDHNEGYIKSMAYILFKFDQHKVIVEKDPAKVKMESNDNLIAWNYPDQKFVQIENASEVNCQEFK